MYVIPCEAAAARAADNDARYALSMYERSVSPVSVTPSCRYVGTCPLFTCLRHLARRLLNQTCTKTDMGLIRDWLPDIESQRQL